MNIKEYILSGIVESYTLGLASETERIEFEQLCLKYPELVAARNDFEEKLEKRAFEQAIAPPAFLKEKISGNIRESDQPLHEAKVIPLDTKQGKNTWWRYAAAAAIILLLISSWFGYDYYSKNEKLQRTTGLLQAKLDSLNDQMAEQKRITEMVKKPGMAVVNTVGNQQNPSSVDIYWDTASTDVYLLIKNMPKLPSEKQYQLWAFINGNPVDLGLFDMDKQNFFLKMKNTQRAEAFAITIEKRGNGPVPEGPMETYGKTRL